MIPSWMVLTQATASRAPAPPRACPVMDLVELMGVLYALSPNTLLMAIGLDGIVEGGGCAVGVDVVHFFRAYVSVGQGPTHGSTGPISGFVGLHRVEGVTGRLHSPLARPRWRHRGLWRAPGSRGPRWLPPPRAQSHLFVHQRVGWPCWAPHCGC